MNTQGFGMVPRWLIHKEGRPRDVLVVYTIMSSYVDEDGTCWPSHATIAKLGGISVSSVERALRWMRKAGIVTWTTQRRTDGGQGPHRYSLLAHRSGGPPPPRQTDDPPLVPLTDELEPLEREPTTSPPPKKPRARNALYDAIVEAFHLDPTQVTNGAARGIGKVAAELKAVGATPEEIRLRAKRYAAAHPTWEATPHALAKHWADPELCGAAEHDNRNWWDN